MQKEQTIELLSIRIIAQLLTTKLKDKNKRNKTNNR